MRSDDRFRFTLQWKADTDNNSRAGELLERLGNKKSEVVVAALCEYLSSHPETESPTGKVSVIVRREHSRAELEAMIRTIIEEKFAGMVINTGTQDEAPAAISDSDILEMVSNLDVFQISDE